MFAAILYPDGVLDHMTVLGAAESVPQELFDLAYSQECQLWLHYFVNNGKDERFMHYMPTTHSWWHAAESDIPKVFKLASAVAS